jgi:hypothetical protein
MTAPQDEAEDYQEKLRRVEEVCGLIIKHAGQ